MAQRDFDLDPGQWATLRRLIDEALEREPAQRAGWLDTLDGPLADFKPRLRELLEHAAGTSHLRMGTLPKVETDDFAPSSHETIPERIGPYRLLRELGSGGMASVWLAERTDMLHGRQVALKLPHGAWRRAGLAERMAREREILATLNHPHIASLYDAGVAEDGQPYLALEYVEGERIDAYCAHHDLGVPARLRLFLQAARAVAHAHANLVVHRDLKPNNILVNAQGEVRLLDFGIAKLLDQGLAAETELTQQSGRALTPDYASPEQIRGEAVGTTSDVYSLGVVLYELLAGLRPYKLERGSRAALEEAILRAEPQRPSAAVTDKRLQRALRGDLDTIVLKALKKAMADRYPTVAALAEDIERHLDHHAVLAQPDNGLYRLRKFVVRNRFAVSAAAAVAMALIAGAAAALLQSIEATRQRDAAVQQQRRASAHSEFLAVLLQDGARADQALTPTQLLDSGIAMLERQTALDDSVAAYMWFELSRNYTLFSQTDRELALLDRSAAAARHIGDLNLLAASECAAAWALLRRDRTAAARRFDVGRQALGGTSTPAEFAREDCMRAEAALLQTNGQAERAIPMLEEFLRRDDGSAASSKWRRDILRTQLGVLYRATERFKDALVLSEQTLQNVRAAGRAGTVAEGVALINHAINLCRLGEYLACFELQRELVDRVEKSGPSSLTNQGTRSNAAVALLSLGEPARALELVETDLVLTRSSGNIVVSALNQLLVARALADLGRHGESIERLEQGEAVWSADPKQHARMLREATLLRAQLKHDRGDGVGAQQTIRPLLALAGYPAAMNAPGLDRLLRMAARIELRAGDAAAAETLAADALRLSSKNSRTETSSGDVGLAALLRAEARAKLGRRTEAEADAVRAAEALRNGVGAEHADTRRARALLAELQAPAR